VLCGIRSLIIDPKLCNAELNQQPGDVTRPLSLEEKEQKSGIKAEKWEIWQQ
jgi:hypothetical protein